MKRLLTLVASLAVALTLLNLVAADTKPKAADAGKRGPLVHMVSFKFKPEAGDAKVKEVETAFAALPGKITQIMSFEWGTNISPEKLDKGFTHGFILTFKDAKDRDAYLVHPAHAEFGKLVGPALADVFVVDFLAKN